MRIKFAYYLNGWSFDSGNKEQLKKDGKKISPSEYEPVMDSWIFCPVCNTNLIRVPKGKDHFSNGRAAYFAHLRSYKHIKCYLRSTRPEGKRYDTYEEARRAVDDETLVIVNGFMKSKPRLPVGRGNEYNQTPVEDVDGPVTNVPIARHNGESFKLPSKIKTVLGICRNFDDNFYKHYYLPGQQYARRLSDLLVNVKDVSAVHEHEKLYYGVIKESFNAGSNPSNIRMTKLTSNPNVVDFYFKGRDGMAQEKGIYDDTKGRIIIMYGKVAVSGVGLCIEGLGWGEYALLPEKYNDLLLTNT